LNKNKSSCPQDYLRNFWKTSTCQECERQW